MILEGMQIVLILVMGIAVLGVLLSVVYRLTRCQACRGRGRIVIAPVSDHSPAPTDAHRIHVVPTPKGPPPGSYVCTNCDGTGRS